MENFGMGCYCCKREIIDDEIMYSINFNRESYSYDSERGMGAITVDDSESLYIICSKCGFKLNDAKINELKDLISAQIDNFLKSEN